jgi:glutamate-1-semialdehyde 2,1-aminomutase
LTSSRFLDQYQALTPESRALYDRAVNHLPSGSTRASIFYEPYPRYVQRASGCCLYDVDGHEVTDFLNNYTSQILGHAHPRVTAAAQQQLLNGSAYGAPTRLEVEHAEELKRRVPTLEKVRYTNSGTEATLLAIIAARAYTGRKLIGKVEGGYHGNNEYSAVSVAPDPADSSLPAHPGGVASSAGILPDLVQQVKVVPFNDVTALEQLVRASGRDLAGFICEPVLGSSGVIPPARDYLQRVRELTAANDTVLIFDEVISGFRLSPGGAQALYGVRPDLTTMGKIIGGGFPVGGLGGVDEVMSVFDLSRGPKAVFASGTFNANPVTLTAGLATLRELTPAVYSHLNSLADEAVRGTQRLIADYGLQAQMTRAASLFNIHFTDREVVDYRSAKSEDKRMKTDYFLGMNVKNVLLASRGLGCISAPMARKEITQFLEATEWVFDQLRPLQPRVAARQQTRP